MPLGAPIGSNRGLCTKEFIQILIDEIDLPIIVDAGIGKPSDACEAMEMGAAAVMANTAIATAGNIEEMAGAFRKAIEAGRSAYLAGTGRVLEKGSSASSPLTGFCRIKEGSTKGMEFNDSIMNDDVRKALQQERTDHMAYLPGMEILEDSPVEEQVISAMKEYDYSKYTAEDVKRALAAEHRSLEDFAALLSPAALPFLEEMAQKAQQEKQKYFGNSVCMFTPIYISNYCENYCIYCGFNCHNKIRRARLNEEEIEREMEAIAKTGLQEILILDGRKPCKIRRGIHRGSLQDRQKIL